MEQILLVTRAEAAEMLACSVETVKRLEKQGRLRAVRLTRKATGRVRFRRDEIVALLQEHGKSDAD